MGARGPKADPKKQELLGNPRKQATTGARAKAKRAKQKVVAISEQAAKKITLPEPPPFLNKYGRNEWDRIVPQLVRDGKVSAIHSTMLGAYCQYVGRAVQAEHNIATAKNKKLYTVTNDVKGTWMPAAELAVADRSWKKAAELWKAMGIDKRKAATIDPPDDEDEPDDAADDDGCGNSAPDPDAALLYPRRR